MFENKQILVFFEYDIFEPPERYKTQRKTAPLWCGVSFGGSGWIPSRGTYVMCRLWGIR